MKIALKEWLMLGIGVLVISVLIFGAMYQTIENRTNYMKESIMINTNLPPTGNQ